MTVFWIVVALFLLGALLLLIPPLWVLPAAPSAPPPARRTALALALLVPLGSIATYLALGSPPDAPAPAAPSGTPRHEVTPAQIQAMASGLADRLKANPADAEGWAMLARSYTALGRYRDAVAAFRRADELLPGQPGLLADHADVAALVQGKRLSGEPARLIQRALDADPRHPKALALAGSAAFEARDYAAARGYWERLALIVPAGSATARSVQGSLAEARRLEALAVPDAAAPAAAGDTALSGVVELAPELAGRVAPGDTLFVFARALQGTRMPLAILRRPVGDWPAPFRLDDSQAMAPELRLSGFAQVVIGVRVSRSGNATPQPGDLVGQSAPLAPGASGLRLSLDRIQP